MPNMKKLPVACLLLFCFSALVKGGAAGDQIEVGSSSEGVKVTCPTGYKYHKDNELHDTWIIKYEDSNSGEYECKKEDGDITKVFVKFRTCDNCIELDVPSITGMIVGNVVATFVIGVSVYLLAKHTPDGTSAPKKKGSDKHPLVQNEVGNDMLYQPLRHRNGQGDVYDKLRK